MGRWVDGWMSGWTNGGIWRWISTHLLIYSSTHLLLITGHSFAEALPTTIKSDLLEYKAGIYTARGGVLISQENRTLTASEVTLDNNTGDVTARGNVELVDGDNVLSSDGLRINLRTNYLRIDKGSIFIKEDNYHIDGNTIERLSQDRFRIKSAAFTTCDGSPPCWRFKGRNINIHLNHMLKARGVSFSIRDVPVFYLPYIALPILQERQTGFLIPRVGYNTGEGLKINSAFFWAISRSQDATLYADYYGKKGWGSGLEYRYILSDDTRGQFNGYYINDIQVERTRWNIKYNHRQRISEDLSAKLRVNYLDDKTLFKDISEDIGERLQRTQDSDLYVNRRWDASSLHLWTQYTQNLSGNNKGIFQRLPEAGFKVMGSKINNLPLYWSLTSSASRWDEKDTDLTRLHFAPRISARFLEGTGIVFIPEAGMEQTFYEIAGEEDHARATLYNLSASLSTKLYKPYPAGSGRIEHFIEPAIRYEYAEGLLDGTPPLLDPLEKERGKNILSLSIINRLLSADRDKKYEALYLRLTQMYRVTSPPPTPSPLEGEEGSGFSDLRLETVARLHDLISIDVDTTYSYRDGDIRSAGTDLRFKGGRAYLTLGQRYSKDNPLNFLTASAGVRLYGMDASADLWYDNKDHLMRESLYTVRYGSQCWGVTFAYRYRPEEEQVSMLFTLKGVGSVGGF